MTAASSPDSSKIGLSDLLAQHSQKELLRFITCGSVDDGKSTLIGRLLLETGSVYLDQIEAAHQASQKHGTHGDEIDSALLLDGLEDERQQGITIDVAYRYFTTSKRKFIIADTPGHEQFTRNMVTGASTTDLALILVDASKGILKQTKRHAFIVSLLGIRHVVLAVNKMDLVDYDQKAFEQICKEFQEFASKLEIPDIRFVPLSALKGDNVSEPSPNMLWNESGSLLHLLENVYVGGKQSLQDFRFPVQWVNRPHPNFRGFSGTIASGSIRVDDEVVVLPSNKTTRVRRIVTQDGDLQQASASQSITLTLADEFDVTRGDMLARPHDRPMVGREADAILVWLSEQALVSGKRYWVKQSTRRTSGEVTSIRHSSDINTLDQVRATTLRFNEIGHCRISFHDPIVFDAYRRNRSTGSFILVDRISHETVAAGMLLDGEGSSKEHWEETIHGARLEPATSRIAMRDRVERYGQQPYTLLITGLCRAGKTTLALDLEQALFDAGKKCVVLDGQSMRLGISRDLGFTAEERSENLRRAAEIAKTLNDAGLICVGAFVAPHDDVRERVKRLIGAHRFFHVHLSAPASVCEKRDASGQYRAARLGEIPEFPGVTSDYQVPQSPDLTIPSDILSRAEVLDRVQAVLGHRLGLHPKP